MEDITPEDAWASASRKVAVADVDECWIYTGPHTRNGYGKHSVRGRHITPHRAAYEALVGPIASGMQLDHLCRVRDCCNPKHLEPVTCRENLMRGDTTASRRAAQSNCVHGHEFNATNTRIRSDGTRTCIECSRIRARAYKAKVRNA